MCKMLSITDSFTDYKGNVRKFILVAASIEEYYDLPKDVKPRGLSTVKTVSLGISVLRDNDTFDEELGKRIALGKALKYRDHCLMATKTGLINTDVVAALLKQEAAYFKENPGSYLAGYDKDAAKYRKQQELSAYKEALGEDKVNALKTTIKTFRNDFDKTSELVKTLM